MAISQGEAVFQAVSKVVGTTEHDTKVELDKADLQKVYSEVYSMFESGMTIHGKSPDSAALKKYIPGLVNNWLRKDKRLNGGMKYEAKNPGSRTGSGDATLKAMRQLLAATTDSAAKEQIQEQIDLRIEALKPKTEIDVDALPASLRQFVKS